jgi:hypothetical protein
MFTVAAGTTWQGTNLAWQAGCKFGVSGNTNGMATAGAVYELFDAGLYYDPLNTGVAPAWEMPDEAQELVACQRYWQTTWATWSGYATAPTGQVVAATTPVMPRIGTPAVTAVSQSTLNLFPSTTTPVWVGGNIVRDSRTASGTGQDGIFSTNFTINARM